MPDGQGAGNGVGEFAAEGGRGILCGCTFPAKGSGSKDSKLVSGEPGPGVGLGFGGSRMGSCASGRRKMRVYEEPVSLG